jgi:hypothetical protein
MDCTFCLDCVHACPHDNVGIVASTPGGELWLDSFRSGIGRWSKRWDLAALVLVLVFGAFANAAFMTTPVMDWRDRITEAASWISPLMTTTLLCMLAFVAVPMITMATLAALSRWLGGLRASRAEIAARFSFALVPLGFGMWLAHYSFHLFTSYATVVPATQRFAADLGGTFLGAPSWNCACCLPTADWLLRLEIVSLDLGLLLSLYAAYRIAQSQAQGWPKILGAFAPWALLILFLFAMGIWLVFQPMQMRGTM